MVRFRDDGWPRDWYCKYEDCSSQIINIFVHLTSDKKKRICFNWCKPASLYIVLIICAICLHLCYLNALQRLAAF